MEIKIKDAAGLVGGIVTGNSEITLHNVSKIEEAKPGDLTFLYLPAYQKYLQTTKASAVLIKPGFEKIRNDITYIEVNEPNIALQKIILTYFTAYAELEGIDVTAFIHPSAKIGENAAIGRNVVVSAGCKIGNNVKIFHNTVLLEDVVVDDDTLIYQNVSIREKCCVGKRVIIHSGTVIGSDGFGYIKDENNVYNKVPQIGNVIIEDDVELGSNVSIDRAALGSTLIKKGAKIDNLVQIAHNVVVGENTVISSQTGISGSTKIGNNCILAGQVGIVGHIEIGDNVIITAQSGVSKSISKPGMYFGYPAKEHKTALKLESHVRNLPAYVDRIKELETQIKILQQKLSEE